jgi:hypothetical protein
MAVARSEPWVGVSALARQRERVETSVFFPAIKVLGAYLFVLAGIVLAGAKLTSHVTGQAVVLAMPLFSVTAPQPKPTLVEQRRLDAAAGIQPSPRDTRIRVAAMDPSEVPPGIFAAELDRAEKADLPAVAQAPKRTISSNDFISFPPAPRAVSLRWKGSPQRRARYAALRSNRTLSRQYPSAAEEFNRRFTSSLADAR